MPKKFWAKNSPAKNFPGEEFSGEELSGEELSGEEFPGDELSGNQKFPLEHESVYRLDPKWRKRQFMPKFGHLANKVKSYQNPIFMLGFYFPHMKYGK
jgi:hypothetical protein